MSSRYHLEISRGGSGGSGGDSGCGGSGGCGSGGGWNILGAAVWLAGARMLAAIIWACFFLQGVSQPLAQTNDGARPAPLPGEAELRLIESLYREGDAYRAESEILRFLRFHPDHPLRPEAELTRAKLFYREGRFRESDLIVFSLLDRHPRSAAVAPARRLLAFSLLRQGNLKASQSWLKTLAPPGEPPLLLDALARPHPEAVDPDAAEAWSTWLPGSGYFAIGQPGKAATAITLNLALLGATAFYAREERPGAALLFLFFELMLWQGGRSGVRQDAETVNRRLQRRRVDAWLRRHGEPALLQFGIMPRFGIMPQFGISSRLGNAPLSGISPRSGLPFGIGIQARFGGGRPLSFQPLR